MIKRNGKSHATVIEFIIDSQFTNIINQNIRSEEYQRAKSNIKDESLYSYGFFLALKQSRIQTNIIYEAKQLLFSP